MERGDLVPDKVVIGMISSKLDANPNANGFICYTIETSLSYHKKILLGEEILPALEGISKENYKSVKRFSSLLPSEVVTRIFESKLETIISHESINGDRYWTQSSNEFVPNSEELVETVSQYEEFYNNIIGQQLSGFIDHTMKQGQRVRLKNFASNN